MKIWLLAIGCVLTSLAHAATYRIGGVVVNATSGDPARRVRVAVARYQERQIEVASLVTAPDGRFQFDVPAGKYELSAVRNGTPRQRYGLSSLASGFGIAIVTGPDQKTDNLMFRLYPASAIHGRVLDQWGEPVENALIQLIRSGVLAGRRHTSAAGYAYTNDLGEYRFGGLPSGNYYIAVSGHPWHQADQSGFASVYYPNTADPRSATPVAVGVGEDLVANFSLRTVRSCKLSVSVEGAVAQRLRFQLTGEGIEGARRFQQVIDGSRGAEMAAVPPGHYELRVMGGEQLIEPRAVEPVDITSSDVSLTVQLRDPPSVSGKVEIAGQDPAILYRMLVTLVDEEQSRGYSRSVSADGNFSFPAVNPGRYRVRIANPKGYYAVSVEPEDGPLQNGLLDVALGAPRKVKVQAASGTGRVHGFVYKDGAVAPGVIVVLAPEKEGSDIDTYRGFQTDSDGSFDFEDLRAGGYRLFTATNVDFEYATPAAVRPYRAAAKLITVAPRAVIEERVDLP